MKAQREGSYLALGVHPTSRGFGWAAFQGPFFLYDFGLHTVQKEKNASCLAKIEGLIERLRPETLVLESFERPSALRSDRIQRLYRAIVALAQDRGIDVAIFGRADIHSCFKHVGAVTRQEIAQAVVRHVDAFRHMLPARRRAWQSEDKRMALFCAAALVLTHYHFGTTQLLEELHGMG